MLGDALKQSAAAQTAACLDAETAAAWADGALSEPDRGRAEGHVASCARCQALVAALVRTAPPALARSSWFRLPTLAWVAPLAAAAAVMIVWAILPASKTQLAPLGPVAERPIAEVRAPASPPQAPQSALTPVHAGVEQNAIAAKNERATGARSRDERTKDEKPPEEKLKAFADRKEAERQIDALAKQTRADDLDRAKKTVAAADKAAAARSSTAAPAATPAVAPIPAAAPPASTPPPAPPPAEPQAQAKRDTPAAARGGTVAQAQRDQASADARARLSASESVSVSGNAAVPQFQAQLPIVVLSPNPNQRWRIVNSPQRVVSTIEYSTDGGTTWTAQQIAERTKVTTGMSPSPSVCWMVGPQGTVLLTPDGRTWQQLVFPEAVDLVAVRATDAMNATVTAADGRTLATTDGGATWTPSR